MATERRAPSHVVITGASSGLGAALARAYAKPGVLLTLSGRHEARLAGVAADCAAAGAVTPIVATSANQLTDRSIREAILFWNIGTSPNSAHLRRGYGGQAECSHCSRFRGHSHRNTLAESTVHTAKVTASTTRSPR